MNTLEIFNLLGILWNIHLNESCGLMYDTKRFNKSITFTWGTQLLCTKLSIVCKDEIVQRKMKRKIYKNDAM